MPTLAYVANANKVSVIDTNINTVVNNIIVGSIGDFTKLIAVTPNGRFAYVTNLSDTVSVIDTCTNTVVDTITVGDFPVGVAVTPNGKYVYVANSGLAISVSGTVSVIDTNTNMVVDTITVGSNPRGVAITPDGNFAYVTIAKEDSVSVIDTVTNTVVDNITVSDAPQGIAITPNGRFAYVANAGQSVVCNKVFVINISTNTVIATITVGSGPYFIAITSDSNFAYVTNVGSNNVSVIDTNTNTVIQTIPVGSGPFAIAVTPDGNFVYVSSFASNNVSVINTNTNTVVDIIQIGSGPLGIAIANIPPCPTPSNKMCIETTRIFDSCIFEEQQLKTFKFSGLIKDHDIQCEITETRFDILKVTKIDEHQDLVDVKLRIKVFLNFKSKCSGHAFKRVVSFNKNITLVAPEGANVCCEINSATYECIQTCDISRNHNICCTVKITAVVKSKKLVQIEVPFLGSCGPGPCSPRCNN